MDYSPPVLRSKLRTSTRLLYEELLKFVDRYRQQYEVAPPSRLLRQHFGWKSSQAALINLREMHKQGYIQMERAQNGHWDYSTVRLTAKGKRLAYGEDGK